MITAETSLSPSECWQPLPSSQWNEQTAAHLLRRIGFSARPIDVQSAMNKGLEATVDDAFTGRDFGWVEAMWEARLTIDHLRRSMRGKGEDEKREINREIRQHIRHAHQHFGLAWLEFASKPENSAQEKYVLFLESIFVVAYDKVKNAGVLYDHQNNIRRSAFGSYRDLVKDMSRSPAMIQYLDLQRSTKEAPNENFARELMELFTLGEGNYTERDVKEAARAFTGYGYSGNAEYYFAKFNFNRHRYDSGYKEIFGQGGRWNGDEVIEIIFEQPGARTFLPRELGLYYLSETPISEERLRVIGDAWAAQEFDQKWLLQKFFTSRLFFEPAYRGEMIKSPIHYYLGLCQDLNLDVYPVPKRVLGQLRTMGQEFQNPPNVRGWQGGKHWITSSTLSARQGLVRNILYPQNERQLNADQQMALQEARDDGKGPFVVDNERLQPLLERSTPELVDHLCQYFLPQAASPHFKAQLVDHIDNGNESRSELTREALLALLQSPQYQLS